jgi:Ca2+-binding RTX toxin-like protein
MKTFMLLTALSVIILAGCSTSKSTADYDDVYSTTKKKSGTTASGNDQTQVTSPDYYEEGAENIAGNNPEDYETGENVAYSDEPYLSTTETVTTPEGTNYITNNYYEGYAPDDYYDYSYASSIDRFYSPYMGYN